MKIYAALLLIAIVLSAIPTLQPNLRRFEYQQNHMGTRFVIRLYTDRPETAEKAAAAAFARIEELNSRLSDYRDDSELNQLCKSAADRPVTVSEDLFRVLNLSREWSEMTNGAFDITAAPVIRLWRRARRIKELPDPNDLRAVLELVGYRKLRLDSRARSVRFDRQGIQLDLGGIAKGFAADQALAVLARDGIDRALVAAGGDVVVGESPPDSPGWIVGVSPFSGSDRAPLTRLVLRRSAVSTSGDAEQFVEIEGARYSHIIDPKTGRALIGPRSVTVVAPSGSISDPAATSLSVLGIEDGLRMVDSKLLKFGKVSALFASRQVDGQIRTRQSREWKNLNKAE